MTALRPYIHGLFIFALILAGLSPACKFISGQYEFMEICGFDGMKTVAVEKTQNTGDDTGHQYAQDECAFCFSHANVKVAVATLPALTSGPDLVTAADFPALPSTSAHHIPHPFDARGPPTFL